MHIYIHSEDIEAISVKTSIGDSEKCVVDFDGDLRGVTAWLNARQAETLYVRLGQWLQDQQRQAHPEATESGEPIVDVYGDDTMTVDQLQTFTRCPKIENRSRCILLPGHNGPCVTADEALGKRRKEDMPF